MNNILSLLSTIISFIATSCIAIFTGVLLRINRRQHKLDYEQELRIHPCKPTFSVVQNAKIDKEGGVIKEGEAAIETQLACVLVNSSALPLVIKRINVKLINEAGKEYSFLEGFIHDIAKAEHIYGKPALPKESPPGIFIKSVPWVIAGKSFTVFSYKYDGIPLEYQGAKVIVEFIYYNEYRKQELTEKVEDELPTQLQPFNL